MKVLAAAFAASLVAGSAYAQATPPASPSTPPSSTAAPSSSVIDVGSAGTSSNRAADNQGMRPGGHGAFIRMRGPGGVHVAVRCADGESTRACAETVMQLVERSRGMSGGGGDRRRDWDDDDDHRGGGRVRPRGRDY